MKTTYSWDYGNNTLYGGDGVDELYGGWGPNNGTIDNNDTCYDVPDTVNTGCEVFYEQRGFAVASSVKAGPVIGPAFFPKTCDIGF